jgi:penicillin-insensitive murein endopeptidase
MWLLRLIRAAAIAVSLFVFALICGAMLGLFDDARLKGRPEPKPMHAKKPVASPKASPAQTAKAAASPEGTRKVAALPETSPRQAERAAPAEAIQGRKAEAAPIPPAGSTVQTSPASFEPSPQTPLSQAVAAPPAPEAPKSADARARIAFETSVAQFPVPDRSDMVRLAATAAQFPAPNLARIPAVVEKLTPARLLFARATAPAAMATRSIGFYAKGCLAGAKPLPVDGPAWQAMRLSRNRMWGHPLLVKYIERFAKDAKEKDGWPGLLVGDMSMPRGGPMPFGHASHQVGLDVDIWYRPMPERQLTKDERETMPMESFLVDPGHVNPAMWSPDFAKLLRRSVSYPEVARVFVNPAIKKWLCDTVKEDRAFLRKITPIHGHDDHFHVRLSCPAGDPGCKNQPALLRVDEGCGKGLDTWIAALSKPKVPVAPPPPPPGPTPGFSKGKGRPAIMMAQLPPECEAVLKAPALTAAVAP